MFYNMKNVFKMFLIGERVHMSGMLKHFCNIEMQGDYIDVEVSSGEEEVIYHEEEDVICSQPIEPYVGMEFDNPDQARRLYNEYSIHRTSSRKSAITNEVIRKEFECTHVGKLDSEHEDETSASSMASGDVSKRKRLTKDVEEACASKKKNSSVVLYNLEKVQHYQEAEMQGSHGNWTARREMEMHCIQARSHTHPLVKQIGRRKHLMSHRRISRANYEMLQTLHQMWS